MTDRLTKAMRLGLVLGVLIATARPITLAQAEAGPPPLDPALRARLLAQAQALPRLRSLLVSLDGRLLEEHYFNGARADRAENLKSASKSILSALVGVALDRGYLKSVRDRIGGFFAEHWTADNPRKRNITIEDLLTMRSGLEGTSHVNYGRWVQSRHWVRHVLTRPLIDEPGGRMIYSTGNSHLLSALLTKATGMSTFDFARRYLADPLGVPIAPWVRDPQGIFLGGNEMHWTPRGMLAFGEMYLNGGRVRGKQVVSETWIRESLNPRTRSRWSGRQYGYGWWIDSLGGHDTYFAWGHGGQFIFVVPKLRLVITATSTPAPDSGRREHQRAIYYDLIEREIVPAAEMINAQRELTTGRFLEQRSLPSEAKKALHAMRSPVL